MRGGQGKKGSSYIHHTFESSKSREQFSLTLSLDDAEDMVEVLGKRVDIGTIERMGEFAIIMVKGDSLSITNRETKSKAKTVAMNSIKDGIKRNLGGGEFMNWEVAIERIIGEPAFIIRPTEQMD